MISSPVVVPVLATTTDYYKVEEEDGGQRNEGAIAASTAIIFSPIFICAGLIDLPFAFISDTFCLPADLRRKRERKETKSQPDNEYI